MTDEEYEKTPDLRAFCYHITKADRTELLLDLADIQAMIDSDSPPKMDIEKYTFNNYKDATAKSLTDEELAEVERQVETIVNSSLPAWKKNSVKEALEDIKERRGDSV